MKILSIIIYFDGHIIDIKKTIHSIKNQRLNDYEIIIISENLSTEKLNKIKEIKVKNPMIKTFNYNMKVTKSICLNKGLILSEGKYFTFLNPGDILENNSTYDIMINQLEKHDLSFATLNVKENKQEHNNFLKIVNKTSILKPIQYGLPLFIENNVYSKKLIIENNIVFPDLKINSDKVFLEEILQHIDSYIHIPLYYIPYQEKNDIKNVSEYIDYIKSFKLTINSIKNKKEYHLIINEYLNTINEDSLPIFSKKELKQLENEFEYIINIFKENKLNFLYNKYIKSFRRIINKIKSKKELDVDVSVIVPVYNVEKYLKTCLNSIIKQTHKNIEIICIEDSSTDKSPEILKQYAKKDKRIKIIHNKENKGLGASRNIGLKQAKGKYIQFVDSDDWIDLNTIETAYNMAEEKQADFVVYKALNYNDSNSEFYVNDYYSIKPLYSFIEKPFFYEELKDDSLFHIAVIAWNKLYLKSFLDEINAVFPINLIHEDVPFFYHVFCEAKIIVFINNFLYNRRERSNSIMNSNGKFILGTPTISDMFLNVFLSNHLYNKYKKFILNRTIEFIKFRHELISKEYTAEYYENVINIIEKFLNEYQLEKDFKEYLNEENLTYFNNILNSNNSDEFNRLMLCYSKSKEHITILFEKEVYAGTNIDINTLVTKNNSVLNTGKITLMIDKIWIGSSKVEYGHSNTLFRIPLNYEGRYIIQALYQNNQNKVLCKENKIINIKKAKNRLDIIIPKEIKTGTKLKINTEIIFNENKSLNEGKISFKINDTWIGSNKIENGESTIDYNIPSDLHGIYKISTTYIDKDEKIQLKNKKYIQITK